MTFIRHEAKIVVGPRNIDIALELTFHEYPSLVERRRMDRNHDDSITMDEIDSYLAGIADALCDGVSLSVDGRPVQVMPLYSPQVDLLGESIVVPSHHLLRLSFFARTPDWLRPGSRIRAEYRLWSETPRIDVLNATGSDGIQVVPADVNGSVLSTEAVVGPRVILLSCQTVATRSAQTLVASSGRGIAQLRGTRALVAGALSLCILAAVVLGGVRKQIVRGSRTGGQT